MGIEINVDKTKSEQNYYADLIAFVPFILLLFTGIVMLGYHVGKPYSNETLRLSGYTWILAHKILTVIALPLITVHLLLHLNWIKKIFSNRQKSRHRGKNVTLLILFLLTAGTSLLSWLVVNNSETALGLRGIHNKIGILLIIFFILHLISYFKWLLTMTKRVILRKIS